MCSLLSRWLTTLRAHDCRMQQSLWRQPLGQEVRAATAPGVSTVVARAGLHFLSTSQGSLSDPAPAHLPPAATCSPIQQLLLPLQPPLDCCCCCFQVWIRRSQITLVHPPFLPRPPASLSRSASVYKAPPSPTMRPLICSRNEVGSSWDGIIRDAFLRDRSESIFPLNQSPPPTPPPTTHNLFLLGRPQPLIISSPKRPIIDRGHPIVT